MGKSIMKPGFGLRQVFNIQGKGFDMINGFPWFSNPYNLHI